MNDFSALLRAVVSVRDDYNARLVMADWFEENDQPARAETIRLQCELASNPTDPKRLCEIADRLYHVEKGVCERIVRGLPMGDEGPAFRAPQSVITGYGPIEGATTYHFVGGFVEHVACTAEFWLAFGDQLHWHPDCGRPCADTAQPLRFVTLTSWPIPGKDWFYRLHGVPVSRITHFQLAGRQWHPAPNIEAGTRDWVTALLAAEWPGVGFLLPGFSSRGREPEYAQASFERQFVIHAEDVEQAITHPTLPQPGDATEHGFRLDGFRAERMVEAGRWLVTATYRRP